ncbi:hypothetical protein [Phaeobacter italicus]|jgi:hypothetical protein|uniref:hypothetical protein n=1 Tax=Phaeobacter italicus TaxID=481446 RepID=UPI002FDDE38F
MTDLIKAADALANRFEMVADDIANCRDVEPNAFAASLLALTAYRQARESADGVKVKPLVWRDEGVRYTSGDYAIEVCGYGQNGIWHLTFYGAEIAVSSAKNSLSHLKRKAWNHHVSYIKAALED